MKLTFDTNNTILWLIVFTALALASSFLVYYKNRNNSELLLRQTVLLAVIRGIGIFLLLLLFLNPVIVRKKNSKEKPLMVLAIDHSQSLSPFHDDISRSISEIQEKLDAKFQLETWLFGDKAAPGDTPAFVATQSNYGELFNSISAYYINRPPDALIILGDGMYNAGQNPLNLVENINSTVYTVGLGDTTQIADMRIREIKHPRTAFLDRFVTIEADFQAEKMNGKIARIDFLHDQHLLESKNIVITGNNFFTTELFRIQATSTRLQKYSIRINTDSSEQNTSNNIREFVIQVIDTRQKVLIISDGPHPDCGAIRSSLESYGNYEVSFAAANSLPENPELFDLYIWHQLPSAQSGLNKSLLEMVQSNKPLLIIAGSSTALPYLNNLQLGLTAQPQSGINEAQFAWNEDFTLFKTNTDDMQVLQTFPPVNVPAADYQLHEQMDVFGFQKLKGIETRQPLFAFTSMKQRKIGFILGEGIWRWRLHDFRLHGHTQLTDELISKLVNYLTLKENKEKLRLFHSPIYAENEEVIIEAELYNDSYEPVNSPELELLVSKDSLTDYRLVFDRKDEHYQVNLGRPEAGLYHIEAVVQVGSQQYSQTSNFRIVRMNLEEQQTTANHQLLYQLASESGGLFITPDHIETLCDSISANKGFRTEKVAQIMQNELINLKWFFFLLIFIFGMEWFLRKYWGIY